MTRLAVPALLIVVTAAVGHAARPAAPERRAAPSTTKGQLLVATEDLRDPRFVRTVVYMLRHDATGAIGLVVNRPLGSVPFARVLEAFGRHAPETPGEIRVHYGGPVDPERGFVLHTREWASDTSRPVHGDVAVTSDPGIFEALASGAGPRRALFAAGYAGWAPGQLEAEINGGYWLVVTADEALIFDDDAASKWERATQRRRITL